MKCLECGSPELYAHVQASLALPILHKGGGVNTKGFVVKQTDVKEWWCGTDDSPKLIRGPIVCVDCLTDHVYLKGLKPALRKMTYQEAMDIGYETLAASSEKGDEEEEA